MRHAPAQCTVKASCGESDGACCALLTTELFALHQMHHSHQQTRKRGIYGSIRRFESHSNQPLDKRAVGLGCLWHRQCPGFHPHAQRCQALQPMKGTGNMSQQVAADRVCRQLFMDLSQCPLENDIQTLRFSDHGFSLQAKLFTTRSQKNGGRSAFPLQPVHEIADALHQLPHLQKILEVHKLAPPRCDQVRLSRGLDKVVSTLADIHFKTPGVVTLLHHWKPEQLPRQQKRIKVVQPAPARCKKTGYPSSTPIKETSTH